MTVHPMESKPGRTWVLRPTCHSATWEASIHSIPPTAGSIPLEEQLPSTGVASPHARILDPRHKVADMAAAASPSSVLLRPTYRLGGPARRPSAARCCLGDRDAARSPATSGGRRQSLLLLLSLAAPLATEVAVARAQDIPLFGLRKKLRKIEEGAEEIVREGEKAVEGIVREGEKAVEEGIEAAEKQIGAAAVGEATGLELGLGADLAQAGAVAAAEAVAVLAAVSVVNGILGSEGRSS